jgi:hypothetical protein
MDTATPVPSKASLVFAVREDEHMDSPTAATVTLYGSPIKRSHLLADKPLPLHT